MGVEVKVEVEIEVRVLLLYCTALHCHVCKEWVHRGIRHLKSEGREIYSRLGFDLEVEVNIDD